HASRSCRFRRQLRSSPRMLRSTLEATSRTSALYCPLAITALSPETFSVSTVLTSPTAPRSRARSRAASETLTLSAAAGGSGATAPPSGRTAGPATAGSIGPFRSFTFMIQALTSGVFSGLVFGRTGGILEPRGALPHQSNQPQGVRFGHRLGNRPVEHPLINVAL